MKSLATLARVAALATFAVSSPWQAQGAPAETAAARTLAQTVCVHCHGAEGRSKDPTVPILEGQQRQYLEVALKEFRTADRRGPESHYMWGIGGAWLTDEEMVDGIADYFSKQAPVAGSPADPKAVALGRQIYETAVPGSGYPACAACHGARAEGLAIFPRLANQSVPYLMRQMTMERIGLRTGVSLHTAVLKGRSDADLAAVAAYLQSPR